MKENLTSVEKGASLGIRDASVGIKVFSKAQLSFLAFCEELGYGTIEVKVKNGEPVMASQVVKDTKFD